FRKNESKLRLQAAEQLQAHRRDTKTAMSDVDLANSLILEELDFDEDGSLNVTWKRSKLFRPGRIYTLIDDRGKFDQAGVSTADECPEYRHVSCDRRPRLRAADVGRRVSSGRQVRVRLRPARADHVGG